MAIQEDLCSGYDYNFVDDDLSKKYSCSICHLVARDPQQVSCCNILYCKICLQKLQPRNTYIRQSVGCPSCRKPLGNYFSDGRTEREIKSLKVHCTNSEEGCKWKGTINETGTSIEAHLNDSCPYQLIPCTNECGENIRRSTLETHLTVNCPKRLVKCEYCQEKLPYCQIKSDRHLNKCPDYPLKCSNEECEEVIPRRLLATHNETCPKAIITCEYNTVGCNKRMKREEKEEHDEESVKTHLQMAVKRFKESQDEVIATKDEVTKLKAVVMQSDILKLCHFSEKKKHNEEWYSPCFYTSPGGYKMRLKVYPNGDGNGKGTHVSCYICLMLGEYDDTLESPFQGEAIIELLNQRADTSHLNEKTSFTFNRCLVGAHGKQEFGIPLFIHHSKLNDINRQYLKDDILYFRVSVTVKSQTKPWLVGVTRTM